VVKLEPVVKVGNIASVSEIEITAASSPTPFKVVETCVVKFFVSVSIRPNSPKSVISVRFSDIIDGLF
jgi:hypothetical protein